MSDHYQVKFTILLLSLANCVATAKRLFTTLHIQGTHTHTKLLRKAGLQAPDLVKGPGVYGTLLPWAAAQRMDLGMIVGHKGSM